MILCCLVCVVPGTNPLSWVLHCVCNYEERCEVTGAKMLTQIPWNSILAGGFPEPFYHGDTYVAHSTWQQLHIRGQNKTFTNRLTISPHWFYICVLANNIWILQFHSLAFGEKQDIFILDDTLTYLDSIKFEVYVCAVFSSVLFKTSTKNGGYVDYTDREWRGTGRYYIQGSVAELKFELGFDYVPPWHCYESLRPCQRDALHIEDFNIKVHIHQCYINSPLGCLYFW